MRGTLPTGRVGMLAVCPAWVLRCDAVGHAIAVHARPELTVRVSVLPSELRVQPDGTLVFHVAFVPPATPALKVNVRTTGT